jgi:hypothetical protein
MSRGTEIVVACEQVGDAEDHVSEGDRAQARADAHRQRQDHQPALSSRNRARQPLTPKPQRAKRYAGMLVGRRIALRSGRQGAWHGVLAASR